MTKHMRTILTLAAALTLIPQGALTASDQDDVLTAEHDWAQAVTARDFSSLQRIYSDDLIYAHSTGVVETKQQYLDKLKTGATRYDLIRHERTLVKVLGDAAIAHSMVRMQGTSQDGPFDARLMMLHVWVKQGDQWRLAAHQTTRLEDLLATP